MNKNFDYINENLKVIQAKIKAAAERSGKKERDITLIAVSKTVDTDRINCAINCGIKHLGENRVQELCDKYEFIVGEPKWHLIGHLQTNKVKYIIDKVAMIHSVDRLELANEIQKRAERLNKVIDILVQVNIADEESKFGLKTEDTKDFLKQICNYSNLKVKGLMTIAPIAQNQEDIRWVFKDLSKLRIDIVKENIDNIDMDYISMGMSNDFEIAIEEGANIVRVGTAIFGRRSL
jgi:pyridoxal phosphate enzyme (YggS family)